MLFTFTTASFSGGFWIVDLIGSQSSWFNVIPSVIQPVSLRHANFHMLAVNSQMTLTTSSSYIMNVD
jgi:hypothetical protein